MLFIFCLNVQIGFGQANKEQIIALIRQGIELHDVQKYDEAIEKYKEVLKIDKDNLTAFYEMALTYIAKKDYKNAIICADKTIKGNFEAAYQAYDLKGTALDELGKRKEALKNYEKGIQAFPKYAMLHYNKAITLMRLEREKEAEASLKVAIGLNPSHASSHYYLAALASNRGDKIQTILAYTYFLFIETDSKRSETASGILHKNLKKLLDKESTNGGMSIELSGKALDDKENLVIYELFFAPMDKIDSLKLFKTLTLPDNANDMQKRFYKFCQGLQRVGEDSKSNSIWHNLYIPFMKELIKTEHLETASYLVSFIENKESAGDWLQFNQTKLKDFGKWYQDYFRKR